VILNLGASGLYRCRQSRAVISMFAATCTKVSQYSCDDYLCRPSISAACTTRSMHGTVPTTLTVIPSFCCRASPDEL
jgi:hypothetical protein